MAKDNISIEILDYPSNIPPHFITDGRVFLDVDGSVKAVRELNEGKDSGSISTARVIPSQLRFTGVNRFLLGNTPCKQLNAVITHGRAKYSTLMTVFSIDFAQKRYLVKYSGGNWVDCIEGLSICDVISESVLYDTATVAQYMANDTYESGGGELGLFLPITNYGAWLNGTPTSTSQVDVTREDLRFAVSPLWLLEKAFCLCGYEFRSPILESDYGRRQWRTLLKRNYWEYEGKASYYKSVLLLDADKPTDSINPFYFDSIQSQGGGNYAYINPAPLAAMWDINPAGLPKICTNYCLSFTAFNPTATAQTFNVGTDGIGVSLGDSIIIGSGVVPPATQQDFTFCVSSEALSFSHLNFLNTGLVILAGATLTITQTCKHHYPNDLIPIGEILDCEILVSDIIKAEQHLFNGILTADENNKIVTLEIPFNTEVHGESVKGLYGAKTSPKQIDGVLCDTTKISCPDLKIGRYQEFSFNDETDDLIQALQDAGELGDDPLGYSIDLGLQNAQTNRYTNPLYEPSLVADLGLGIDNPIFTPYGLNIINAGDNGGITYNVNPRAFIGYYGRLRNSIVQTFITFEGVNINQFGIGLMMPTLDANPVDGNNDWNLSFEGGNNHYSLFYEHYLRDKLNGYPMTFRTRMSLEDFQDLDFGEWYTHTLEGTPLIYRIIKANYEKCYVNMSVWVSRC